MKKFITIVLAGAAFAAAAREICDLTLNPEARDGHTPADPSRFFTVCSSKRFEAHPSAVMLADDKTILAFWDIQQAGPCGPAAISTDAGRTWTRIDDRIPKQFSTECHDEPQAWLFTDPKTGKERIRVFASYGTAGEYDWRGPDDRPLAEAMPSIMSEDGGATWQFMPPLGADFACVVGFSGMVRLKDGSYLGVFSRGKNPNGDGGDYRIMGSVTRDGGLTWEKPFTVAETAGVSFFIPSVFRSPDGNELCCMAIDARKWNAWASVSRDEGKTWSAPAQANNALAGSNHSVGTLADGRIVAAFAKGHEIRGWIGTYKSLLSANGEGLEAKLVHNYGDGGTAGSPSLFVRRDGEIVVVAHSQINLHKPMPAIVAMRFSADEVEEIIKERESAKTNFEGWNPFKGTTFRPLENVKLFGPFAQELVMKDMKERTLIPFDGSKQYITKAAGTKPDEISSKNGTFEISKHAGTKRGNAAILVWTVTVQEDCKTRLRLIGSPSARCCVNGKVALPAVCAGIFDSRTADIQLKKGDNDIAVMVYKPQDRASMERGFHEMPLRIAAAIELENFTYKMSDKIDIDLGGDNDMSLDFEL